MALRPRLLPGVPLSSGYAVEAIRYGPVPNPSIDP